jgi:hypothetical protein
VSQTLAVSLSDITVDFQAAMKGLSVPVAKAATLAIKDAGAMLKSEARSMIAGAGFSVKWQKAYRVKIYPERKFSVDAAAFGYFNPGLHYSDIFATGGQIHGHPFLWIPFSTTPTFDRRRASAAAKDYARKGVKLVSFKSKSGRPLLAATVLVSKAQANSGRKIKLTTADILAGSKKYRGKRNVPGMVKKAVPLFFGVSTITIKKRLEWAGVQVRVQEAVPGLYSRAIDQLADK